MKKVFILFLLMPALASGQITDDFESGNLDQWVCPVNGRWKADITTPLSGIYSLRHIFDNPLAGYDQAGISLKDLKPSSGTTTWSFKIRHGYNPSSSNSWGCFLMSDAEPSSMMPGGNVNGFAVGVNLSGSDDTLRLWKIKNGSVTKVLSSRVNWEKEIGPGSLASITVKRSALGEWEFSVLKGSVQPGWIVNGTDNELFSARWFGIYYKYTSTADRLLWVDDVKIDGVFYTDSIPPHPDSSYLKGKDKIIISFDEAPDISRMKPEDFVLNPGGLAAVSFRALSDRTLEISFGKNFKNKSENELIIKTLCDSIQNCTNDVRVLFTPVWAETGDVLITEVMADPVPAVGLPEKEYIEITNTSGYAYNLKGWSLVSGSSLTWFPEKIIAGNEIIILCSKSDTSFFKSYGRVIGMTSFPVLNDQGKMLMINNEFDELIHGIEYSADWYGDVLKSEGGWSLEMVDTDFPFYFEGNWGASVSRMGGSPGTVNSISGSNTDKKCPVILNVFPEDSVTISVSFSKPVIISPEIASGIEVNGVSVKSIKPEDPLFRSYSLVTGQVLEIRSIYELFFPDEITDFSDNSFCIKESVFGVFEPSAYGDIKFNELLFNPYPGGGDYIEFYNCSEKVIDAASLLLISIDDVDTSGYVKFSEEHRCIMPDSYYVVTTEKQELLNNYFSSDPAAIFEVSELSSMDDDQGHLVLFNKELDVIDEVIYDEDMHFVMLSDLEGVALEKIRPCLLSSDKDNWHSASESSGWGTPGYSNSVYTEETADNDIVILSSTKITPDNDGYEDFLVMDFKFRNTGNVVSVTIYDEMGYRVNDLANNLSMGITGSLIWNGMDSNGSLVGTGIYIVYFSFFDETGKVTRLKKVCTVLRR